MRRAFLPSCLLAACALLGLGWLALAGPDHPSRPTTTPPATEQVSAVVSDNPASNSATASPEAPANRPTATPVPDTGSPDQPTVGAATDTAPTPAATALPADWGEIVPALALAPQPTQVDTAQAPGIAPPVTRIEPQAREVAASDGFALADGSEARVSIHRVPGPDRFWRVEEIHRHGELLSRRVMAATRVLVRRDGDRAEAAWQAELADAGAVVERRIGSTDWYRVTWPGCDPGALPTVQNRLAKSGLLQEPDYIVWAIGTPDDSDFDLLWGLHNTGQTGGTADADIDAVEAWDLATGSRDIVVGVIDTGIDYRHPDLADNLWINPGEDGLDGNGNDRRSNGIDDDGNGYVDDWRGWDFVNNDNDPMDDHFHGTHCAGTIGGTGNNADGVAGVAWQVSLVGLKFLSSSGGGSTSDAVAAVDYARGLGLDLTSNSWGGGGFTQSLKDAIDAAGASGQLFVAAAGNSNSDNDSYPHYPSSYESTNIVAVAASDHNDYRSSFSSYGATSVDLAAPGTDIYSTFPITMTSSMSSRGFSTHYETISGTSMATPHVAGACALLLSLQPGMTPEAVRDALIASVDPLPAFDGLVVANGRLNLHQLLLPYAGPRAVLADSTVIEDGQGDHIGDGDGFVNPGERIGLELLVANSGSDPILGATATLSLVGSQPDLVLVGDTSVSLGDIPAGDTLQLPEFLIDVLGSHPTPATADLQLTVSGSGETWNLPVAVDVVQSSSLTIMVSTLTGGTDLAGASISIDGTLIGDTDSAGSLQTVLADGSYTVTASLADYRSASVPLTMPRASALPISLGWADLASDPASLTGVVGEVPVTQVVQISNPGDLPLTATTTTVSDRTGGFVANPPALLVSPGTFTVPAGDSVLVEVTIDPTGAEAGTYAMGLFIDHDADRSPSPTLIPVDVTVEAIRRFAVTPTSIDLGDFVVGHPQPIKVTVQNTGNSILGLLDATSPEPLIAHDAVLPRSVPFQGSYSFTVWADPLAPASIDTTLDLLTDADIDPVATLPVTGEVTPFGPLASITVAGIPAAVVSGDPVGVTLTGLDSYGNQVLSAQDPVDLAVVANGTSPLALTECHPGTPDFVELQNVSDASVDATGWTVAVCDSASGSIDSMHSVVWTLDEVIEAGGIRYRTDSSSDNYWGSNIWWTHSDEGWAILVDPSGTVRDAVVWGFDAATIATSSLTVNGASVSLADGWSGDGIALQSSGSVQRIGAADNDDANDWQWATTSLNMLNSGLDLPFPIGSGSATVLPDQVQLVDGEWIGYLTLSGEGTDLQLRASTGSVAGLSSPFSFPFTRLAVDPTTIDFGSVMEGTAVSSDIVLSNEGNVPLTITGLSSSDPAVTLDAPVLPVAIASNGSLTVTVTWQVAAIAPFAADIAVTSDAEQNPDQSIAVAGTGIGRPVISVDTSPIAFTLQPDGQVVLPLAIDNLGSGDLHWSLTPSSSDQPTVAVPSTGPASAVVPRSRQPIVDVDGPGMLGTGGPDSHGYHWIDSLDPAGPTYSWQDISQTGSLLSTVSDALDAYEEVVLGFDFPFYGESFSSIYVGSNGYVTLGSGATTYHNYALPSGSAPAGLVAGFYDDLYPGTGGSIYAQVFADHVIVQFQDVVPFSGSGSVTFQMVLHADGQIVYFYNAISMTAQSCTVGLQNRSRDDGLTVVYNAAYLQPGMAVAIRPPSRWLSASPRAGTTLPSGSDQVDVVLDSSDLSVGDYSGELTIEHDDPLTPALVIPVSLAVRTNQAPVVTLDDRNIEPGSATLTAEVVDDGLPYPASLTYSWSASDPAVQFDDSTAVQPQITVAQPGSYTVDCSVSDGGLAGSDSMTLTVAASGPQLRGGWRYLVDDSWQRVDLPAGYSQPVVVATVVTDAGREPVVARVRNVDASGFDLRVQQPGDAPLSGSYTVSLVVAEAGVYTVAEHGIALEAGTTVPTAVDHDGDWSAEPLALSTSFTAPVVLAQVQTAEDAAWSVAWTSGASRTDPASAGDMHLGYHVAEDPDTSRNAETLGYIVLEAGTVTIDGITIEAALGSDSVLGFDDDPPYSYAPSIATTATAVAGLTQSGMDGGNGGWPVLYGSEPIGDGRIDLAIDEDQLGDDERVHISEQVAYVLFSASSLPANNRPPTAVAQAPAAIVTGSSLTLDGSASSDPDGDLLSWTWTQIAGPALADLPASGPSPTITVPVDGSFTVELTVSDGAADATTTVQFVAVADLASGPKLSRTVVEAVGSDWQPVSFGTSYIEPVVVGTVQYADSTASQAVVRLRNVDATGCELRVQAPDDAPLSGYRVFLVAAEAGVYNLVDDGIAMEARLVDSTRTDHKGDWQGEDLIPQQSYSDPIVLGQVQTSNDADWSVFWARGGSSGSAPSSSTIRVGKHVGEDPDQDRADETLGVLILEAGSGSQPGLLVEAGRGPDIVKGMDNAPPFSYSATAVTSPTAIALSSCGMDGGDGAWPVLIDTGTVDGVVPFDLAVDEDTLGDSERGHTTEEVGYLLLAPVTNNG